MSDPSSKEVQDWCDYFIRELKEWIEACFGRPELSYRLVQILNHSDVLTHKNFTTAVESFKPSIREAAKTADGFRHLQNCTSNLSKIQTEQQHRGAWFRPPPPPRPTIVRQPSIRVRDEVHGDGETSSSTEVLGIGWFLTPPATDPDHNPTNTSTSPRNETSGHTNTSRKQTLRPSTIALSSKYNLACSSKRSPNPSRTRHPLTGSSTVGKATKAKVGKSGGTKSIRGGMHKGQSTCGVATTAKVSKNRWTKSIREGT